MRFALIDNNRVEASIGQKGICQGCLQTVIAKCGDKRINHWAHTQKRTCDSWWEPETEWHRNWKNNFPTDWQEIFLPDENTGEKHIADVRTGHGLVIEFQHSHIAPKERISRERFYGNMIWVVDGTRLKRDFPRFLKVNDQFQLVRKDIYKVEYPDECFPIEWLNSSKPIIFDFLGDNTLTDFTEERKLLYCLFPVRINNSMIVAQFSRRAFIKKVINGDWIIRTQRFINDLNQVKKEKQYKLDIKRRQEEVLHFNKLTRKRQFQRGRRF